MRFIIDSRDSLEQTALKFGLLPFFQNNIPGFSVAEMTVPGMLFGGNEGYDGCWEWKGPVIQEQSTAYGKFFRRKAGFVSLELLPDFLNYRRSAYPVSPDSTEAMILDIIRENEGLTSTELRKIINGPAKRTDGMKRSSMEGPLQRLQMGGRLLIANFEYKHTRDGNRYGWGVALYSTPEIWFGRLPEVSRTPMESLDLLTAHLKERLPGVPEAAIRRLIS